MSLLILRPVRAGFLAATFAALALLAGCSDSPTVPTTGVITGPQRLLVPTVVTYSQVSAGFRNSCAVTTAGAVICWGDASNGVTNIPVAAQSGVAYVTVGGYHACALSTGGGLTCWGNNEWGQTTVPVEAQTNIAHVSAGSAHTCAITTAGALRCWGYSESGGYINVPLAAQSGMAQVDGGLYHSCAVSIAGAVTCWGDLFGYATPVAAQSGIATVSAGGLHACAVSSAGALTCWGSNNSGETTIPAGAESGIAQVGAGASHTCALRTSGAVVCWGFAGEGATTVPLAAQSNIVQLSTGHGNNCALNNVGAITCWGADYFGDTDVPSFTTHVLPTATFNAPPAAVIKGQSFMLTLTNAQVPGHSEATAFTFAFDCGTGAYAAASASAGKSCAAAVAGATTVRGKVIDQDGDVAEYTGSVTVLSAVQATAALRDLVLSTPLFPDVRHPLSHKLDEALKNWTEGKTKQACNAVADFGNQVKGQRGKAVPTAAADLWLAQVAAIRIAAGC